MIKKAVILAGGFGTRFLPATKGTPKEMFTLVDKPALMYALEECKLSGIKEIIIIINPEKTAIKNFLKPNIRLENRLKQNGNLNLLSEYNEIVNNMKIKFFVDKKINGSGGVVESARKMIGAEPFVLIYGDDFFAFDNHTKPAAKQLIDAFDKNEDKLIVGGKRVDATLLHKYGVCKLKKEIEPGLFELDGFEEKPKINPPSDVCGLGRYIIPKDWINYITKVPQKNHEKPITDMFNLYVNENRAVVKLLNNTRYDLGSKLGYAIASTEMFLKCKEISEEFKNYLKNLIENDCTIKSDKEIFSE